MQQATLIFLMLLLFYFLWMDVNLYHKIQKTQISWFPAASGKQDQGQEEDDLFSPFAGFSVKLVLLDQGSNYVYIPLAAAFEKVTDFSHTVPFVTADMISATGVLFACIAARFVLLHDVRMHRLAVFFFQVCFHFFSFLLCLFFL